MKALGWIVAAFLFLALCGAAGVKDADDAAIKELRSELRACWVGK